MSKKDNPVPSIDLEELRKLVDKYEPSSGTARFIARDFVNFVEHIVNQNGVETNKVQPKYELETIDINATDNPLRIRIVGTHSCKTYLIEGLAWKLIKDDQEVMHYIYSNFDSEID